jgi:NADH-quinone oxidoreductase subunit J
MKTRGGEWVLAAVVGGSMLYLLVYAALGVARWQPPDAATARREQDRWENRTTAAQLGGGLLGYRVDRREREAAEGADASLAPTSQGMSGYLLPFEIVSVHLLVVLIAAAYLARPKKRISTDDTQP